ncbi:MAG: hypothetical protein Q9227_000072 [Pyrenula ochraceoflavens]
MSGADAILSAASSILSGLARGAASSRDSSPFTTSPGSGSTNGLTLQKYHLPGANTPAKQAFEAELSALARRIQYLESKADSVNQTLPDTPNELPVLSPFEKEGRTPPSPLSRHSSGQPPKRQPSIPGRSARISNLLAARDPRNGELDGSRTVSEADINIIREHVEKQAEQISCQKEVIEQVKEELHEQSELTKQEIVRVENEDVGLLERELRKHQQANEAFQKALREIGGIITQVANGDLSMRVQIHSTEMDPEISAFKKTINSMMDQLGNFGDEVSRVAREVGTQGQLGGQAHIQGVQGVWRELTENG